jgi:glycosyltransferase involved in cell wall biosynthesis
VDSLLKPRRGWCQWIGAVDDATKWALLAETAVVVMCSDSESFGMSVLEALAAKTPVVVTRTCPWEIIETEGCGLWVEQRPDAIAGAILEVLQQPSQARAMGERGRELARRRFAWPVIGREMANHYARALGFE